MAVGLEMPEPRADARRDPGIIGRDGQVQAEKSVIILHGLRSKGVPAGLPVPVKLVHRGVKRPWVPRLHERLAIHGKPTMRGDRTGAAGRADPEA